MNIKKYKYNKDIYKKIYKLKIYIYEKRWI